jgi:hypothetical protein
LAATKVTAVDMEEERVDEGAEVVHRPSGATQRLVAAGVVAAAHLEEAAPLLVGAEVVSRAAVHSVAADLPLVATGRKGRAVVGREATTAPLVLELGEVQCKLAEAPLATRRLAVQAHVARAKAKAKADEAARARSEPAARPSAKVLGAVPRDAMLPLRLAVVVVVKAEGWQLLEEARSREEDLHLAEVPPRSVGASAAEEGLPLLPAVAILRLAPVPVAALPLAAVAAQPT